MKLYYKKQDLLMSPETHVHQNEVEEKKAMQLSLHSLFNKAEHKLNNN